MRIAPTLLAGVFVLSWLAVPSRNSAHAQEPALVEPTEDALDLAMRPNDTDAPAAPNTDSEMEAQAAVDDRVDARSFMAPSLLIPVDHLFGDWRGLRPKLEDNGLTTTITWVSDMAGNPVGGRDQGFTECENLGMDFLADLDKMYGMSNAKFHVSASQRSGSSLTNDYIGNSFNVQQVFGGETFKLIDVEYVQRFCDGKMSIHAGRIAAGDDFLTSPYYWVFVQNGIDGNPVGIFKNAPGMTAYPNSTWGARLRIRPTPETYVMAGVYNGDPSIRDNNEHGLNWTMNGPAFFIAEAAYQRNGQPGDQGKLGTYKVGAYYNAGTFTNFAGQYLGTSAPLYGLASSSQEGNYGFYALADQVIFKRDNPNTSTNAANDAKQGIGVFTSIIVAPEQDINEMPFFCNGGVVWRGPCDRRPGDLLGLAVVYGAFSDNLRAVQRLANAAPQTYETALECCYRFRMRDGAAYFQPDLQYIFHPGGTGAIANAFVVGCQMGLNF
jgi:porin